MTLLYVNISRSKKIFSESNSSFFPFVLELDQIHYLSLPQNLSHFFAVVSLVLILVIGLDPFLVFSRVKVESLRHCFCSLSFSIYMDCTSKSVIVFVLQLILEQLRVAQSSDPELILPQLERLRAPALPSSKVSAL